MRSLRSSRQRLDRVLVTLTLSVCALVFLFPLYWLVGLSLKTRLQIFTLPPDWVWMPTLENFLVVLGLAKYFGVPSAQYSAPIFQFFTNSLIIASSSVSLSIIVGVPSAYAFARFRFRWDNAILFALLVLRLLPPIAVLIPLYRLMGGLGLLNTHIGLILAYTTFNLPFVVWVMRGYFLDLPKELEDAALVDGCNRFGAFLRVMLPLTRPGIVASAIFALMLSWNDFIFAAILSGRNTQTLPVLMASYVSDVGVEWGALTAGGVLVILPVLVFTLIVQRHLISGLTAGAVRG